jgi:Flp pilus assembly protein TadD
MTPVKYRRAFAQYLSERKIWNEALAEWDTIVTQAPADAEAQFSRGLALEGLGQRDRALEAYRTAVSLDGSHARFRLRLAQILWAGDQYYQAIAEWRAVAAMDPKNVDARLALGAAYLRVGEPVEAFREYREVLAIAPGHPEALRALARMGTR